MRVQVDYVKQTEQSILTSTTCCNSGRHLLRCMTAGLLHGQSMNKMQCPQSTVLRFDSELVRYANGRRGAPLLLAWLARPRWGPRGAPCGTPLCCARRRNARRITAAIGPGQATGRALSARVRVGPGRGACGGGSRRIRCGSHGVCIRRRHGPVAAG